MSRVREALTQAVESVESELKSLLPAGDGLDSRVFEAMTYALFAGGKRLRPFFVLTSAELFEVPEAWARRVAAAVELSLIHI